MVVCYLYPSFCLFYKLVCDVTLNSVILSDLIILWADPTLFSIYIHILYIIVIYKSVQMTIFTLFTFLHRDRTLLFTWSLARTTDKINNIIQCVSTLIISTYASHTLMLRYFNTSSVFQCVSCSVVKLQRYIRYSEYIGFKLCI